MAACKTRLPLLAPLVFSLTLSSAWGALIISNSGDQHIVEGQTTTVTFTVTNTFAFDVILDYAAAIITVGPVDPSDWAHFAGVNGQAGLNTAALLIPAGQSAPFIYNLMTDTPDIPTPGDNDSTMNYVDFETEFSPSGNTGALNNVVLNKLNNLLLINPNQYPAPGSAYLGPTELLYGNGIQGQPVPSELIVNVSDTPEPSYFGLAGGLLLLLGLARGKTASSRYLCCERPRDRRGLLC